MRARPIASDPGFCPVPNSSARAMEHLFRLTARDIVRGAHESRWTARDAVRSALARIDSLEPRVQAWTLIDAPMALARAEALADAPSGVLHGVPVAIKDIIDVAGMPTRFGSPIYADAEPAHESAHSVRALERAGAIVLGKSVTTEFAYYTPRKTRNPWNCAHTPGGSSMGSAAAVACGMVPAALGTQTNGSVIRPAAFCGVIGFKPTIGSVSNHGTLDPWPTLDHTGVFARDVADAALLACVVSESRVKDVVEVRGQPPRLALVRSPVWDLAERAQKEQLESAARSLVNAGAQVERLELPARFDDAHDVHRVILAYEGARHFAALQRQHRSQMSVRFNELLDEGSAIAATAYEDALAARHALGNEFLRAMQGFDALITPPATGEAPATLDQTGNPAFCTIWTLLGAPAITLPVGRGPAGLPLGLQIVSRCGEDNALLATAAWCESTLGPGEMCSIA
jgi:Asp-tRNA(Asn)/Glu-tRNA(Gln) amidotransferase A subunit family amidase